MKSGVSTWAIRHPVSTVLLTVAVVLLGGLAFPLLPIAPLPQAEFPTLQISASLPGASPETMASSVATPLEVQLSAVPGITEMTSSSGLGTTQITLQFSLSKKIDAAAQEVQAAINSAAGRLPSDMPNLPTWRKVNPGDSPILVLSVQSELMSLTELSDVTETRLARQISQIEGVAEMFILGQQKPALRIQASPARLAAYGLSLADLRAVIRSASVNQAKGAIYGQSRVSTFTTNDQIFDPDTYGKLVVTYRDSAPVLLSDVAKISFGAENAYVQAWQNGKPGINLMIRRQPEANIVETADRILDALPALTAGLPAGVKVEPLIDRTRTIRASLHEVEVTLLITIAMVVLVMGLFLRQISATLIVGSVLAVALIATFAAMYVLDYSLNNLTLVALVIAVGFVVDDAIVVVENIHRHLEAGESMMDAALKGSSEIGFTIVSISISLIAAFIPLLFMGGIVGRLFREFALTVTAAILISVVVSLTLAPMLASRFMKAMSEAKRHHRGIAERMADAYDRSLNWVFRHQRIMLGIFGVTFVLSIAGYVYMPKGFFPLQDTAFVIGTTQAKEDISYEDMVAKHMALEAIIAADPAIQGYAHSVGGGGGSQAVSTGRFWLTLTDRSDRDVSASELIDRLRPKLAQVPGIQVFLRSAQDINLGGRGGRAQYTYVLKSGDGALLSEWSDKMTERLAREPGLRDVSKDQQLGASVTRLTIDRAMASRFGISASDIDQVLYDAFGQRQISEYQTQVNQYRVILEISEEQRGTADSLAYFRLRSPLTGEMVPLSQLAKLEPPETGPLTIQHDGMFPAVNLSFNLAPGVALGDVVKIVDRARADIEMPAAITGSFQGAAQAFQSSLATQPLLILAALLAVYIILGVLYESFVHPLTILSTLPSAGIGAVLMLTLFGQDFSVMALIGLVLLIGIVKKNGILVVDFALEAQRKDGLEPEQAIHRACVVRFRPIMMTTIAALLGAIPLMLAFGTGSELRQPLGIAVVGGLLLSQALTLYSTPVVYLALDRLFHRKRVRAVSAALAATLLIGCASVPTPVLPKHELQASWEGMPASSTSSAAAEVMASRAWWLEFHDPALDELMKLADARNLDLRLAEERIHEARALRDGADASLWPEVGISANISLDRSAQTKKPVLSGSIPISASWETDVFGRLRNEARAADASLEASVADRDAVRLSVLSEVARTYVEYRLYSVQLDLTEKNAEAQAGTARITRARFEQGIGSRFDVERALSTLATTRARVPTAHEQADAARHRLALLLASTPEAMIAMLPRSSALPDSDALGRLLAPMEVLAQRPDVRAAELRLLAAAASLDAAEALRYPTLNLAGLIGLGSPDVTKILDTGTFIYSIGAGLLAPLLDFGRISAAIDAADARQQQAYLSYEQTVRTALQEAQTAIVFYTQGVIRQQELARAAESARIAADLARQQYGEGTLSLLEVLDTERSLYDTELSWSQATADVSLRLISVYQTMGIVPAREAI